MGAHKSARCGVEVIGLPPAIERMVLLLPTDGRASMPRSPCEEEHAGRGTALRGREMETGKGERWGEREREREREMRGRFKLLLKRRQEERRQKEDRENKKQKKEIGIERQRTRR